MSNPITVHNEIDSDGHYDYLYVFGAEIADPENDPSCMVDDSTDPSSWAYVIEVAPSEDQAPYLAALESHGLTVVGSNDSGDWIVEQVGELRP